MLSVVEIKVSSYGPREDDTSSQGIERQRAIGSGVMVSADGYMITINHVVAGAQRRWSHPDACYCELVPYHTSLAHRQRAYEAS
jgi:S1-C subfamily serine protease